MWQTKNNNLHYHKVYGNQNWVGVDLILGAWTQKITITFNHRLFQIQEATRTNISRISQYL